MDPEQRDEFAVVRESAIHMLRRGTLIDGHGGIPVCQFLVLPSFANSVSWDVIRVRPRNDGNRTRLYRTCWRMDVDIQAMRSPVERMKHPRPYTPTIECDWVPVDSDKLETILIRFRDIRIPLTPLDPYMGADGTSYELAVGTAFCHARLYWWWQTPNEWQELMPVIAELQQLFESTWKQGRG